MKLVTACIQNCATPDVEDNIDMCTTHARRAAGKGAKLICLPEYFSGLRTEDGKVFPVAYPEHDHPVLAAFSDLARELDAWFLLGSVGITSDDGRIFNRSYVIDAEGTTRSKYDKIHMFDVNLGKGQNYRESATIAPGNRAEIADTPWGGIGLSVCYDLRFPALYRNLAQSGATILAVPAAFTRLTGQAHWHVLNRARAIENGCFVIAPCQHGTLHGGAECYGHSLIIDPWGQVLADCGAGEGIIVSEIDLAAVPEARQRIPSLNHDREFTLLTEFKQPA